jgi:hypothetical protein
MALEPRTVAVKPIRAVPGTNVEVDAFNLLLAGITGDMTTIEETVSAQDRLTNEHTLACALVWFSIALRAMPEDFSLMMLRHFRKVASATLK